MKNAAPRRSPRPRADKYRSIFPHSAVPLWELDISALRAMIQGWRTRGILDVRSYLNSHPGVLKKAIRSIIVLDKGEWAEPKSPQARVKGVGLSLAVCQSTVGESGGWIEVESVPGQGSTFRVLLPAPPAAPQ